MWLYLVVVINQALIDMWVKVILGSFLYISLVHLATADKHCRASESKGDSASYPKTPLTFAELRYVVLGGERISRTYYEVYSLDPTALKPFGLPVLRKVAIRWKLASEGEYPGSFTNDYTGWNPYNSTHPCELGIVAFTSEIRKGDSMGFKFQSVYPTEETMVGTSFSSCPERYLINWYCPKTKIDYDKKRAIKGCKDGARMSIYSSTGPNNMPWHLIVEDLCRNDSPRMDDKRWTMTYDAPRQCEFNTGGRKKRDVEPVYTEERHYL